jgi:hypothetical protein
MNTELRDHYFAHYDKLKPIDRESAKANWDEDTAAFNHSPATIASAIMNGLNWTDSPQGFTYWKDLYDSLWNGSYSFTKAESEERMATEADWKKLEEIAKEVKKDTNPKDSIGVKKVPMSGMPAPVLMECGLVKLHGDLKYGRYNWRDAGVRSSVYYDACMRHLMAWWEGEDLDPDSGVHHLAHAMTGLAVLRDSQLQGNCNDDRPKPYKIGWISDMNKTASKMIDKHNR